MISSWVTEAAPWRFEVPTQSEPVSPPPITTTCLPLATGAARRGAQFVVAGVALVLLGQEFHGEMDAVQLAAGDPGRAAFGAARQHHRVEVLRSESTDTWTPTSVECGRSRLRLPSAHAAVDQVLFHLEVGNAVAQQAADPVGLLEHGHAWPARASCCAQASPPGRSRRPRRDLPVRAAGTCG
jgi:hypothetical protein